MNVQSPCPPSEQLARYAAGDQAGEDMAQVALHLAACSACREQLAALRAVSAAPLPTRDSTQALRPSSKIERDSPLSRTNAPGALTGKEIDPLTLAGDAGASAATEALPQQLREYRLLARLGAGGMGTVYQALHTHLDRIVALKVLPAHRSGDADAAARFRREMRAVGRLNHPHIIQATDAGEVNGIPFLVMEYVEGIDLAKLVGRRGPLPVADACEAARQAALALDYAHQHGLIHRDVKPGNLLLSRVGQVKLLDLGLALLSGAARADEGQTDSGMVMGSFDYIAPEQGEDPHAIDARADLYSLGCTLFHLLTGRPPFAGPERRTPWQKLKAHTEQSPPSLCKLRPEVPEALASVVDRLLAKSPADRYPNARAVAAELAPFTAGSNLAALISTVPQPVPLPNVATITASESPVPAEAAPAPVAPPRPRRRWPAAVVLALLLAGVAASLVFRTHRDTPAIDTVNDAGGVGKDGQEGAVPDLKGIPALSARPAVAEPGEVRRLEGHTGQVDAVAVTPDGKIAVSGGMDASVRIWDVATGKQLRLCMGVNEHVWALAISPDGRFVLGGGGGFFRGNLLQNGNDFSLHLWDIASGKEIRQLNGHSARVMGVAFTPDGRRAVSCSHDRSLRVWDLETASEVARLEGHGGGILCLALSADGRFALSGSQDQTVRLWDLEQNKEVRAFRGGHTNYVLGVAFSPDGRLALSGGLDRTLRLWDVQTGKEARTFAQHPTGILGVAFSPDGRRALSVSGSLPLGDGSYRPAGYDYVLRLWDVATGRQLHQFEGHTNGLVAGVFLPDGYHALTASSDVTLRLWRLPEPLPVAPFSAAEAGLLQERWASVSKQPAFRTSPGAGKLVLVPPGQLALPGQRHAQVTQPYYLGEHEVTVGQFRRFVEDTGYRTERGAAPSDDFPVTQVTWIDAARFCEWLSQKEGRTYRLPTEAEWEWACRAGTTSPYYFGTDASGLDEHAWQQGSGPRLHPVGGRKANAWGLYDLYGNAAEWCQDWYADHPPVQEVDPRGPKRGTERVIRGGSVLDRPTSATRDHRPPDTATAYLGFRIVCELPEPAAPSPRSDTLFDADEAAYKAWLQRMKEEGFWPTHVHAHRAGGKLHFAAIAQHDPRRQHWTAEHNLDEADDEESARKRAAEGAFPVSMCAYSSADGPRFTTLWSGDLHRISFWVTRSTPLSSLPAWIATERANGRRPDLLQGYAHGGETLFLTRFVYANGIANRAHFGLTAEQLKTFVESAGLRGYRPISLSTYPMGDKLFYAVVLLQDNPKLRWRMRIDMSDDDFRRAQDEWTSRGFRPLLIGGHEEQGQSRWLAVWVADSHAEPPLPRSGSFVPELAVFDDAMDRFLRERGIRAGALAVVKDGKLILARGYGYTDRAGRHEVTPDTPFRLASLSKPITAAAIRKLIWAGKLRWDTPVHDLLHVEPPPGEKLDPRWKEVTVGHLIEHRGGWDRQTSFDPMFRPVEIAAALGRPAPASANDVIRYMAGKPLQFDPGSRTAYSNFGYCLLGRVIEKVSGRTYVDYVQKEIFEPAGAGNVTLGRTLPADRDPREPFYDDADMGPNVMVADSKEWVPAADGSFYLEAMDSHGGLVASAPDLARFLAAYSLSGRPGNDKTAGAAFGLLPGTFTVAVQRGDGVRLVALFNRRKDPSGRDYSAIANVLNQAADRVKHWPTGEVNRRP